MVTSIPQSSSLMKEPNSSPDAAPGSAEAFQRSWDIVVGEHGGQGGGGHGDGNGSGGGQGSGSGHSSSENKREKAAELENAIVVGMMQHAAEEAIQEDIRQELEQQMRHQESLERLIHVKTTSAPPMHVAPSQTTTGSAQGVAVASSNTPFNRMQSKPGSGPRSQTSDIGSADFG